MGEFINGGYSSPGDIYTISFYWCITTITTVGYGDITGKNILEYIFSSLMMVIGVILFNIANGILSSIMANYDNMDGSYRENLEILDRA